MPISNTGHFYLAMYIVYFNFMNLENKNVTNFKQCTWFSPLYFMENEQCVNVQVFSYNLICWMRSFSDSPYHSATASRNLSTNKHQSCAQWLDVEHNESSSMQKCSVLKLQIFYIL